MGSVSKSSTSSSGYLITWNGTKAVGAAEGFGGLVVVNGSLMTIEEMLLLRDRRGLPLRGQCDEPDTAREECADVEDEDDFQKCMERCDAPVALHHNLPPLSNHLLNYI